MSRPFVPGPHPSSRYGSLLPAVVLLLVGSLLAPALATSRPAVRGASGMVVSPERQATEAGLRVLQRGGNAVDAAVATAFALSVTYPTAGNLGGGGFLLYRTDRGRHEALDFRETAPARLNPEAFLDDEGRPRKDASLRGGLSVGVPGSVAGLAEAHALWGSRPWAELVRPAVVLARKGFPVYPELARSLARHAEKLAADPDAAAIFFRDGRTLVAGQRLVQADLARTLERIARRGPEAFYHGPIADALTASVRAAGGVMQADDLSDYLPRQREPIEGRYRGYRIISFPPPSSGGIVLLQTLAMLERFDLAEAGPGSSRTVHLMAEAERRAYADRARWLGDPDFFEVPELLAPGYVAQRSRGIRLERATPSDEIGAGRPPGAESPDTLHLSVADAAGRAVALTTTLNESYGSGMVAAETGILLNNEMDDFALAPDTPNVFGLLGGEANAVAAGKRPLSSMTPTIVEPPGPAAARPLLVLGSPGGAAIITSVLQVLVNVLDHGIPLQEAVDTPRFHHQWKPDQIRHELRAFPADVRRALEERGHLLTPSDTPLGNVNAIAVDENGDWLGAADPRRDGAARGY